MTSSLPILIIIPHGGRRVPEELEGYVALSEFDLFYQSDSCANDIFSFNNRVAASIDTHISRFFVDMDRSYREIPPGAADGIIKKTDLQGRDVFRKDQFPDHIALSNILKRYYYPFHDTVEKIISSGEIELIIECHTMMPIAPPSAPDAGEPRPVVFLENLVEEKGKTMRTCPDTVLEALQANLKKSFSGENSTVTEKCIISSKPGCGLIMKKYGKGNIPFLKLSLSKALFLNDVYFSYDYLRVDELRLLDIQKKIWQAVEKTYSRELI
ncbi:MAG TPA: N-formylglutamate amidohydrolase [Spirochaetota bacterium]|nr:N-formylglutamate amidohydrolase [Spirochaetota bacterium]HPI89214.1 N-formylglutamate amidohydrolase [Spirochaetota bacterium]HPR48969.1 N-formylglutamate amidohydrolase [Spirochaetota bacterium]